MQRLASLNDLTKEDLAAYPSLFRAILANVLNGVRRKHIRAEVARKYFDELISRLIAISRATTFEQIKVETAYRQASVLFPGMISEGYFQRSGPIDCDTKLRAFTIKPVDALRFWTDENLVLSAGVIEDNPDMAQQACKRFSNPANRKKGAQMALPGQLLWWTPYTEFLEADVEDVARLTATDAEKRPLATVLRDSFGLYQRKPGQQLIGVIMRGSIRDLAAVQAPFAPTIFDAWDYERFRHWPMLTNMREKANIGRTYDLDPARRTRPVEDYGYPEFVTGAVDVEHIEKVIYLGRVQKIGIDAQDVAQHKAYAQAVACNLSVEAIINELSERLGT